MAPAPAEMSSDEEDQTPTHVPVSTFSPLNLLPATPSNGIEKQPNIDIRSNTPPTQESSPIAPSVPISSPPCLELPTLETNDVQMPTAVQNAPPNNVQSEPIRTSSRTRRRPAYLDDYVTSSLVEEESEREVATPGC